MRLVHYVNNDGEHRIATNLDVHVSFDWFEKILSGEKREEYREPTSFWFKRICEHDISSLPNLMKAMANTGTYLKPKNALITIWRAYKKEFVRYRIKGVRLGKPNPEWVYGDWADKTVLIIELGEFIEHRQ